MSGPPWNLKAARARSADPAADLADLVEPAAVSAVVAVFQGLAGEDRGDPDRAVARGDRAGLEGFPGLVRVCFSRPRS
jgi:hypothetical protein